MGGKESCMGFYGFFYVVLLISLLIFLCVSMAVSASTPQQVVFERLLPVGGAGMFFQYVPAAVIAWFSCFFGGAPKGKELISALGH